MHGLIGSVTLEFAYEGMHISRRLIFSISWNLDRRQYLRSFENFKIFFFSSKSHIFSPIPNGFRKEKKLNNTLLADVNSLLFVIHSLSFCSNG